ncbi:MAG: ferredoxin:thioredoxin reductase [Thermodesulfovibrio sp.]|nr:ferredoxin:thioredoxin reductase [Thermodesulfovibrio sp.]
MDLNRIYENLKKYAHMRGIELNKDREFVLDLIRGLLRNEERYGYRSCPCRLASGDKEKDKDIICPCLYSEEDIREYGRCYCGLYVSKDFNEGKIPMVFVPERRQKK